MAKNQVTNINSLQRDWAIETIRSVEDEEGRRVEISFFSEEPYRRWYDATEILDSKGVNLERLNSIGVLLFNHNKDKVIGKIVKAWVEDKRGKAIVEFDTDSESELIYQKVKTNTLKGVSVGYSIGSWEEIKKGSTSKDGFVGPCYVARIWTPNEISIVSVPADESIGVNRGFEDNKNKRFIENEISIFENQLKVNTNKLEEL